MNYIISVLAFSLLAFTSCQKETEPDPTPTLIEDVSAATNIWNSSFAGSPESEWVLSSALLTGGGGIGFGNTVYIYSVGYQYHNANEAKSAPVDFGNYYNVGSELRLAPRAHGVSAGNPDLVIVSGDTLLLNGKMGTFLLTMTTYQAASSGNGYKVKKTVLLELNKGMSDERSFDLTFVG